ncbi:Testis-specific expressed protein 55 [Galemys pyrenaicus]|uniref:Testis-specific expressed protein 55 n=1 Tax=Galemys pyrenaicus TaxID=202257 RepID=A0A8J6DW61_GALPY|nr:Testis-specific expressed protein 55 [Galemys pyrenaicus]
MEALSEEPPEESLEPENTDEPPTNNHRDGQEDNQHDQGEEEADDQTNDRTPAQAVQRLAPQPDTDGQADHKASDDTLHETSDQVDLRASKDATNVANQKASDLINQELLEQSNIKAFSQAGYMESEETDSQMSALLEEHSPEEIDRILSNMVVRTASEHSDQAAEPRDNKMTYQFEQRFSDQFDSRLSGLVQQKTSRLPDQDVHIASVKTHHSVYEQDEQVTYLAEDQATDEDDGNASHLSADEAHGGKSEYGHFMDEEEDDMEDFLSGFRARSYFDNRIAALDGDREEVKEIESCTFEASQMNLKNSNISVSSETDAQSTTNLKALESLESRLTSGLQMKKHVFPQIFPSILTKFDHITSQEKTEVTETKSGDVSEQQQGMSFHEYPQTSGRRFPPIVYEDPYEVSLRYMEKHNILQIFQVNL